MLENITMQKQDYNIYKKASLMDFLSGAVSSVSDKVNIKEAPFKTLLSTWGLGTAWAIHPLLGIFFTILESSGDTISNFGESLDIAFGFGKEDIKKIPSEDKINAISSQWVDKIFPEEKSQEIFEKVKSTLGLKESEAMLANIKEIKGYVNENDYFVALACSENKLIKMAGPIKWLGGLFGLGKGKASYGKTKFGLISILSWFIKQIFRFLFGTALLGVGGGVAAIMGKEKVEKQKEEIAQATLYKNTTGDIIKSYVNLLNSKYKFRENNNIISFEDKFKKHYSVPIENSQQMKDVLFETQVLNDGNSLQNISNNPTFKGPKFDTLAKKFFPTITYNAKIKEPINISELPKDKNIKKEVSDLLTLMKG